ncbi:hypothetical protein IJT93_04540 [bacterium]|nr:hypothetical protein [bacterium]
MECHRYDCIGIELKPEDKVCPYCGQEILAADIKIEEETEPGCWRELQRFYCIEAPKLRLCIRKEESFSASSLELKFSSPCLTTEYKGNLFDDDPRRKTLVLNLIYKPEKLPKFNADPSEAVPVEITVRLLKKNTAAIEFSPNNSISSGFAPFSEPEQVLGIAKLDIYPAPALITPSEANYYLNRDESLNMPISFNIQGNITDIFSAEAALEPQDR